MISSVYDPIGILAPFILRGKLIFQELTRKKIGWDDLLPATTAKQWNEWINELPSLSAITIPRCLKPNLSSILNIQLHHFCDASSQGYGVVSYLRLEDINGNISISFLLGKSRLAPIKAVTIPRLELTAACLAVRVNGFLQNELDLPISSISYWTDSKTVIKYINNCTKRFHTFVSNRLATIECGSEPKQWTYVKSGDNPADEASRGMKSRDFDDCCRWLMGPRFLSTPESSWTNSNIDKNLFPDDPELKREGQTNLVSKTSQPLDKFIAHFSDWSRLLKAASWLVRFTKFISNRSSCNTDRFISACEINFVEKKIITYVQRKEFGEIRNNEQSNSKIPQSLKRLNPFTQDGILRVGGRIRQAPISFDLKHPIIIPHHHITSLIIRDFHKRNGHVGCSHTWTAIRQTFWIVNGGAMVRRVIGNSLKCKKRNTKICEQIMADLPTARITPDRPPFYATGVDYFGPILVKQGRSTPKRYGCLFTCLASRAVHLEIAQDLTAASFINALRQFISRRGCPKEMYSDNGTNFVGAEKELRKPAEILDMSGKKFQPFMTTRRIKWFFNTPLAPHMGGAWERMIGSVKKILRCILADQLVSEESLHTLLLEVENIVNCRPILPITLDPMGEEPLTPNHLLLLQPAGTQNLGDFNKNDNYAVRRWRQVQYLSEQFWRRWVSEYLPLLQRRDKWQSGVKNLSDGDIVLVADGNMPRGKWPLAKVLETYPGKDGKVRKVRIKTQGGTYTRPVSKLCRLDIE